MPVLEELCNAHADSEIKFSKKEGFYTDSKKSNTPIGKVGAVLVRILPGGSHTSFRKANKFLAAQVRATYGAEAHDLFLKDFSSRIYWCRPITVGRLQEWEKKLSSKKITEIDQTLDSLGELLASQWKAIQEAPEIGDKDEALKSNYYKSKNELEQNAVRLIKQKAVLNAIPSKGLAKYKSEELRLWRNSCFEKKEKIELDQEDYEEYHKEIEDPPLSKTQVSSIVEDNILRKISISIFVNNRELASLAKKLASVRQASLEKTDLSAAAEPSYTSKDMPLSEEDLKKEAETLIKEKAALEAIPLKERDEYVQKELVSWERSCDPIEKQKEESKDGMSDRSSFDEDNRSSFNNEYDNSYRESIYSTDDRYLSRDSQDSQLSSSTEEDM
ncbi:MAG: hypothetical protein ACOYK6_03810 [Chthoniobacterales bacterium]